MRPMTRAPIQMRFKSSCSSMVDKKEWLECTEYVPWKTVEWPDDWINSVISYFQKKGVTKQCVNYTSKTILETSWKKLCWRQKLRVQSSRPDALHRGDTNPNQVLESSCRGLDSISSPSDCVSHKSLSVLVCSSWATSFILSAWLLDSTV